jgi:hypothetical protein
MILKEKMLGWEPVGERKGEDDQNTLYLYVCVHVCA